MLLDRLYAASPAFEAGCGSEAEESGFRLGRTHTTLMKALDVDGKLVADQLGHGLEVNQNVYRRRPAWEIDYVLKIQNLGVYGVNEWR